MTSATERFKRLLADALERVCVLEEKLEQAEARIAELNGAGELAAEPSPHKSAGRLVAEPGNADG